MDLISCCSWPTPKFSSAVRRCGEVDEEKGEDPGSAVVVRMDCFASRKSRSHWSSLLPVLVVLLLPAGRRVVMMGARCLSWLGPGQLAVLPQQHLWWVKGELGLLLDREGVGGVCVQIGGWRLVKRGAKKKGISAALFLARLRDGCAQRPLLDDDAE